MSNEKRNLLAFAQKLQAEVQERVLSAETGEGSPYAECAFTEILTEYLSELGAVESPEVCFYEGTTARGAIMRVSGYALSADQDRLVLFATLFNPQEPLSPVSKDELARAMTRARRVYEAACEGFHKKMEPAAVAYDMFRVIHSASEKLEELRIFVLTNGLAATKRLESDDAADTPSRVEIWDGERLYRGMMAGLPREEIEIDFSQRFGGALSCLQIPRPSQEFSAYLTAVPGQILYDLYDEFGPRLLELNVRSFLSLKGKVNKGIRRTLREQPERFVAFNNGIVITVDEIETEPLSSGGIGIRSVKGLQIVNGGQTTAAIHRTKKVDGADIRNVFVPAKIIVVEAQKLDAIVRLISLSANSQNVIQVADFSANDPYHVEIERLSNVIWCPGSQGRWFYERSRGQYQEAKAREGSTPAALRRFNEKTPAQRKFTKTELAKFLHTWDQRPYSVSFGAQKNFEHFMQSLTANRGTDWLPDEAYFKELIAKAILFRSAARVVRQQQFPAYQANIVAYLVAYLSSRTGGRVGFDLIWAKQEASSQLLELLKIWSHDIDRALRETAGGRMVSEWAKKEPCWEAIRQIDLALPDPLPPELTTLSAKLGAGAHNATDRTVQITPDDYRNIDACKRLSGEDWLRIYAWGKKTGDLERWQYGIAQTLAGYAATGWEKGPSQKQAKHGVAILDLAREALEDLPRNTA